MAGTTRGRQVFINQTVLDQADYFQMDGFTRVVGLTPAQLVGEVFFNNTSQPWVLTDGSSIIDSAIMSGKLYVNELVGQPGHYSVRFRPNAVGYWRVLLTYTAGQQISAQDYDVLAQGGPPTDQGLKATFTKPC